VQVNKTVKVSGIAKVPDEYHYTTIKLDGDGEMDELNYILGELGDAVRHLNYVPHLTELRDKLQKIWDSLED
jgi:hypothetical protein